MVAVVVAPPGPNMVAVLPGVCGNTALDADLFFSANIPAEIRLIFSFEVGGVVDLRRVACGSDICRFTADFIIFVVVAVVMLPPPAPPVVATTLFA